MITLISQNSRHVLKPTIFPDGTSQVWKLPEELLTYSSVMVDWRFESERELIDIASVRSLLNNNVGLHMAYLPYARQDKEVSNNSTFNLQVFGNLINSLNFRYVSSFDVHNYNKTRELIKRFINISPNDFHVEVIGESKPDFLVYPDAGAATRYKGNKDYEKMPIIICDKDRDQLTGNIVGHKIVHADLTARNDGNPYNFLIVDDLCDGGATFISVAKMIRTQYDQGAGRIDLCVSHGLFSKGREHLLTNGINNLYTTDSLTKNEDGYLV